MSYTAKKKIPFPLRYYIQTERIIQKETVKDLGVTFDAHLTFGAHIQGIVTKSNRLTAIDPIDSRMN